MRGRCNKLTQRFIRVMGRRYRERRKQGYRYRLWSLDRLYVLKTVLLVTLSLAVFCWHRRRFLTVGSYITHAEAVHALRDLDGYAPAKAIEAAAAAPTAAAPLTATSTATTIAVHAPEAQEKSEGDVEYEGNAVDFDPDFEAYRALKHGVDLQETWDLEASVGCFRRAIELKQDFSAAWLYLGLALTGLNRDDEAIAAYKVVIDLPTNIPANVATAYCNYGHIVQTQAGADYALLEEGRKLFSRGLEIWPNHDTCLYNLALAMEKFGRYSEARDLYIRTLDVNPSMGNAHLNLGNIAFRSENLAESISRYERAYTSSNADDRLLKVSSFMLGQIYRHKVGSVRKGVEYYERSYNIDNTYVDALCCILQGWDLLEAQVASAIVNAVKLGDEPGPQSPYETSLTGDLKPSEHLGLTRLSMKLFDGVARLPLQDSLGKTFDARFHGEKGQGHKLEETSPEAWRGEGKGLVVAYWSFDYRDHVMGYLTRGLLCNHQIHDRILTVAASYGIDDGSIVRRSAEKCAGKFLDVSQLGDVEAAKALTAERPDIFVDLMAHTTGAKHGIPALKPAPIVASYLGYPGAAGAEFNDYTIADKIVVPPELGGLGFSEKLVYLPHSYQVNDYNISYEFCGGGEALRGCQQSVRSSRGLDSFLGRFGGNGPVFCNYNNIHKMEPESFTVFMDILRRVPGSVLLLLDVSRDPEDQVEFNLKAEAAARGVHPDRIKLDNKLLRAEHLWRVSGSCDMFVDSFIYGAHTTAADALWAGLPLLTLRGYGIDETPVGKMSGRVGTSLLSALGLPELSFHSVKELEDAAVALAQSPGRLGILREKLLWGSMNSPLFDNRLTTRNLERAYEAMWELREMGLSPRHIVADPTQGALPPLQLDFGCSKGAGSPKEEGVGRLSMENRATGPLGKVAKKGMTLRATSTIVEWEEGGTKEGLEAALVATGRLIAGDPLSIEGLHLRGVALHLLGRNEEAAVVMEKASLLATSKENKESGFDLAMLWENVEVVQRAIAKNYGISSPFKTDTLPYIKALAVNPSEPTPLLHLLNTHYRRGDKTACADAFLKHWPVICGYHRPPSEDVQTQGGDGFSTNELPGDGGVWEGFGDGWAWDDMLWQKERADTVSGIMEAVAPCFVGLHRLEEAWRAFKLAAELQPKNQVLPLRYASSLGAAGHVEKSHTVLNLVIKRLNYLWFHMEGGSEVRRTPRPGRLDGGRPPTVVVLYCFEYGNEWFPNWGPSSLGKGLGGSEEVVVHLSRELARLGFWVEVYADPKGSDLGIDRGAGRLHGGAGVVWYPYKAYDVSNPPDVFVAWRYHVSLHLAKGSGRRFLWLQDVLSFPFPPSLANDLDGIFCPSLYHISLIEPEAVRSLGLTMPNGVDSSIYVDGDNSPDLFVYGSAPNRGLRAVLVVWPYIRRHIPTATLEVYYGFTAKFVAWAKTNVSLFDEWMAEMTTLLNQEGVLLKGMVDHDTLHLAYARAGFVLYPTAFRETGCVSLIKAMAMGAIPITSRFQNSTLPELTAKWDMGPSQPLPSHSMLPEHDMPWLESWAMAVVHASKTDQLERSKYVKDAILSSPIDRGETNVKSKIGSQPPGGAAKERGVRDYNHKHGDFDDTQGGGGLAGSIQALRRAMKAEVREKYAFSATAKLWGAEIDKK